MSDDLIFRSDEASKGGFQAIKKVTGILVSVKRMPSKFEETTDDEGRTRTPKDQAEVALEDALILEMDEGEPEPELKDGKFTYWMNYALPGKEKPHQNTFFVRGFLKSAEKLAQERGIPGGTYKDLFNTVVVLERQEIVLFKRKIEGSDDKEEITQANLVFASDDDASEGIAIVEHIKGLVLGLNKQAALRNLLMDNRAKRYPEYKDALANDTLAEMLGLEVIDGIFKPSDNQDTNQAND